MSERMSSLVSIDFMVQNKIRSGESPPFLGLIPFEESRYQETVTRAQSFLNGEHSRVGDFFRSYPYVAAWLISKTLNTEYGEQDHAVYEHIERLLKISLPAQGSVRKRLHDAFFEVCVKLGLSVAHTGRFVDTYMSQAGVPVSQIRHVIEAFIRQERAFGLPPAESTAALNRWEDDALQFLNPNIVRSRRTLEVDETGYHARLFARMRNDSNAHFDHPFEKEFKKRLEESDETGRYFSRTGREPAPNPKFLWSNNSLALLVPRQEGKLHLWLDGDSLKFRLRGGDEWVLPQPWPQQLFWAAGEYSGEISFLSAPEAFAVFDVMTGRLICECTSADRCVDVDATNVVVVSRARFSVSGQPAFNAQSESYVLYTTLASRETQLLISDRQVNLKRRTRRRISLETEPLIRGPKGRLLNLEAEFYIETGRSLAEKRWIRITIGTQIIGKEINFSDDGVSYFCLEDLVDNYPELKSLSPSKLKIELMPPKAKDSSGVAVLSFSEWIWPSYTAVNQTVLHSHTAPNNLSLDRCEHILLDDNRNICLDRRGGYDFACLTFEIEGEYVTFKWLWPDVSVNRLKGDGSHSYLAYESKIIIGDENRFESIVISCPNEQANLSVRGNVEQAPFYRGMRKNIPLRELAKASRDDRVLLIKPDGTELLLFQVVSKTSPQKFSIRNSRRGVIVEFQLPQMIDAVQLDIEDACGVSCTAGLALGRFPVNSPIPIWLKGEILDADATKVTLEIDQSQYEGRDSLAKILVRQIGQQTWHPLRTPRGDHYAFCLKGLLGADDELLSTSDIALIYKTTYKWLSDCYAQESWDTMGKFLMSRWEALARRLLDQPFGHKELIANAISPNSDDVSGTWIPLVHPIQIIQDIYSCAPENFSPLEISEKPGERELSFIAKISSIQIRGLYQAGVLHAVVPPSFANCKQADENDEKLKGFSIGRYFEFLQYLDKDPTAGWFWNAKPLLGPAHWRNVHLRFVERLENFAFFTDDAPEEGDNSARELSLQRFIKECWDRAEVKPPVPKRQVMDEEQNSIDVWAFAALSEIARASRFCVMHEFLEDLSPRLDGGSRRILGDVSLLIRLAPEAFAFFMLAWHIAKERS